MKLLKRQASNSPSERCAILPLFTTSVFLCAIVFILELSIDWMIRRRLAVNGAGIPFGSHSALSEQQWIPSCYASLQPSSSVDSSPAFPTCFAASTAHASSSFSPSFPPSSDVFLSTTHSPQARPFSLSSRAKNAPSNEPSPPRRFRSRRDRRGTRRGAMRSTFLATGGVVRSFFVTMFGNTTALRSSTT